MVLCMVLILTKKRCYNGKNMSTTVKKTSPAETTSYFRHNGWAHRHIWHKIPRRAQQSIKKTNSTRFTKNYWAPVWRKLAERKAEKLPEPKMLATPRLGSNKAC